MKPGKGGSAKIVIFVIIVFLIVFVAAAFAWTHYHHSSHLTPSLKTIAPESSSTTSFVFDDSSTATIEFPRSWSTGKISTSTDPDTGSETATTSIVFPNKTRGIFEMDMYDKVEATKYANDTNNMTNIINFGSGAKSEGAIDYGFLFNTISTDSTCSWGIVLVKGNYDYYLGATLWLPVDAYGTSTSMNEPYRTYCGDLDMALHHASPL